MPLVTSPARRSNVTATAVFISPMSAESGMRFPVLRGLPPLAQVFIVVSETGQPLLVTDTHAEATRQIAVHQRFVLRTRH